MDLEGDDNGADRQLTRRRPHVPENEVPVSVAFDAMLARTDDAAVFLSGLLVFRNGVRFTIEVRTRTGLFARDDDLLTAVHDGGPTALLLGVELADGRRCTLDRRGVPDSAGPVLLPQGASGSQRTANLSLFLSPLPPAGMNKMLCAWPWLGIRDQVTPLPTNDLLTAAANVVELWPREPETRQSEKSIATAEAPAESWFSPNRWPAQPQ